MEARERYIDAFWQFSLNRYGRDGVPPNCLLLQDELGVDVNIVLLCLWAGERACALPRDTLRAIDGGEAGDWHRAIVLPLRAARRAMKGRAAAHDTQQVETARERLKAIEIESERLEQRILAAAVMPLLDAVGEARPVLQERRRLAQANVLDYLALLPGEQMPRHGAAVEELVGACVD